MNESLSWWRPVAPWAISALVLVTLPLVVAGNGTFSIINVVAINIVFALSYNMLLGQGGMLSFGHAVFFGLGAYGAIHAMNLIGEAGYDGHGFWAFFPVYLLPLVGFACGALAALVVGWPFCRRAGTAFAMITLGLGELVAAGSQMFPTVFGGEAGVFSNRMVGPVWFGLELAQPADVYWFMAFWTLVAVFAMWAFTRTPLGRMSNAVRDNADRLQFIGYPPRNLRFLVFIAAGGFAGLGGGMAAVNYEIVTPESLGLLTSGLALLMAAVGGLAVFYGPMVGAILVTVMNSLLSDYTDASILYVGLVFLAVVMFAPGGLGGGIEQVRLAWRRGDLGAHLPGWLGGALAVLLIALGLVSTIELVYQISHGRDKLARLLGLEPDPASPLVWLGIITLFAAGYGVARVSGRYREARA
ncbi:branched-chain amino acid ABC transporter permease [Alloalcanivorax sp. C16-2]|uniref:branched-chain amino acid ABC transporter permease n=1 Tax=Alloalcanivorax TaxID=3020832 RepID=UPI0019321724|nr:branched-chain amino acid ABC transporter permease [Alloalcanivorax marinus]MBL7249305.1 branched-chain amino acid ABC transporter permease [Alloalcanivorax marinus]